MNPKPNYFDNLVNSSRFGQSAFRILLRFYYRLRGANVFMEWGEAVHGYAHTGAHVPGGLANLAGRDTLRPRSEERRVGKECLL